MSVAKHYLSDRASFTATAKHWAQAYAQAPASKVKATSGRQATDAEMAGLAEANVVSFTDMGFERAKVIAVLKKLNCECVRRLYKCVRGKGC
jgi:ubiquitin-conjugating enzyme (huntingtin interacting protein 2)